ncbi:hypothetical protein DFA_09979 [Cavenderia fasciculata]|uniref:Uncharacterized protein n=1 Tax=Cavenderia fasciculata TaxID=261658 RepID=F4Q8Y6_CACFS|nr:uncharacterized protein DFA_09979 [Cavenderia fasciculata]EGG15155.1 hypothetical protein DFA_09979 [Cavenderia fasciculata]|eukprot:XP_004351875.1 hypothetical protein DFA_09979 [Cavenderia fasciculata]
MYHRHGQPPEQINFNSSRDNLYFLLRERDRNRELRVEYYRTSLNYQLSSTIFYQHYYFFSHSLKAKYKMGKCKMIMAKIRDVDRSGGSLSGSTLLLCSTYFQTCWEAWLQLYRATYDKPFTEFGPYLPKHIPAKEGPDQPNTPIELRQIYSALQATRPPKVNQKTVGQREIEALFGTNIEQIFAVVASVKCATARDTLFRFFARIMKRTPADTNTICYACHTVFDGDTHTSPIIHHLTNHYLTTTPN